MEEIRLQLPDGGELFVEAGSSVADIAYEIGTGLGEACTAGVVDGTLVPKEYRLMSNATVQIVTPDADRHGEVVRETASQLLATAVQRLWPSVTPVGGSGSASSSGWSGSPVEQFYYEFENADITGTDLDAIETEIEELCAADLDLSIETSSTDTESNERSIAVGENPHLDSTGELEFFELTGVSAVQADTDDDSTAAGDEDHVADTVVRVRGVAFQTEAEYEDYRQFQDEVEKRDHIRIGREMDLFTVQDSAPGCPYFYPDGQSVRSELIEYVRSLDTDIGFQEVQTPEMNKTQIWKTSDHYSQFFEQDDAYCWTQGREEYGLKPTDCPNHIRLFDTKAYSYRELPVRYTEIATLYRKYRSGETKGIVRTRRYTQPDGHIFARRDQVHDELVRSIEPFEELAATFDLDTTYQLAVGSEENREHEEWRRALDQLRSVLSTLDVPYDVVEKSSFYAPEIEICLIDELGCEWKGSGYQLDYRLPEKFDLTYTDENGDDRRPVVIHRGLLVSFEYLMGLLLEHFAGRLPPWVAPTQIRVLPISDQNADYAAAVADSLDEFRVNVDDRSWTLSRKIRSAHEKRVPYLVIVGDDEQESGTITVRDRDANEIHGTETAEIARRLQREIDQKRTETTVVTSAGN